MWVATNQLLIDLQDNVRHIKITEVTIYLSYHNYDVKEVADYITTAPGGRGPIRETCEFILRAMDQWEAWVEKVTKMGYK